MSRSASGEPLTPSLNYSTGATIVKPDDAARLAEARNYDADTALKNLEILKEQYNRSVDEASDPRHMYVVFNNTVEYNSVAEMCTILRMMGRRAKAENINPHLTIEFRTPGGEVSEGLRLYDELLRYKAVYGPVTMRVRGEACSMGAVLLQAATTREIGPNARLMVHRIGFGAQGQAHEVEDELHNAEEQEKRIIELFAHRSTLSAKQWMTKIKKARRDLFFNAQESLELGLVDAIA